MISVLCFNFIHWREAWQPTCPPFRIPLLCILDNPTIASLRCGVCSNGGGVMARASNLWEKCLWVGFAYRRSQRFIMTIRFYVQITWWHIIYCNNKVDAVPTTKQKLKWPPDPARTQELCKEGTRLEEGPTIFKGPFTPQKCLSCYQRDPSHQQRTLLPAPCWPCPSPALCWGRA